MRTTRELSADIGKTGNLSVNGMRIPVTIIDARQVWSRVDWLVRPRFGTGKAWVTADRVALDPVRPNPRELCPRCGKAILKLKNRRCFVCGWTLPPDDKIDDEQADAIIDSMTPDLAAGTPCKTSTADNRVPTSPARADMNARYPSGAKMYHSNGIRAADPDVPPAYRR